MTLLIFFLIAEIGYSKDIFKIPGIWINCDYMNLAINAKSLKTGSAIISQNEFPAYLVTKTKEKEITVDYNFHEGGELQYQDYHSGIFMINKNAEYDSLRFKNDSLILFKNHDIRKYSKISNDTENVELVLTKKISSSFSLKYTHAITVKKFR